MLKGFMRIICVSLFMVFGVVFAASMVHAEDYWLQKTLAVTEGDNDSGEDVAVDANKNIFVAARLGDLDLERTVLIKYNPSGAIEWMEEYAEGIAGAWILGVAVDASGNSYVTGGTSRDEGGTCLTKSYDPAGNLRWSQSYPLGYTNLCNDIALDGAGNVTVSGWYKTSSSTTGSLLVIKYDAAGTELCSSTATYPLPSMIFGRALDVDAAGNAYVLGRIGAPGGHGIFLYDSMCGPLHGPGPDIALPDAAHIYWDIAKNGNGIYVIGRGDHDVHLLKYNASGTLLASTIYDGGDDWGNALALDSVGNVYAAGRAGGYLTLKYDPSLNLLWSGRRAEGTSDRALGIDVDAEKNIYVTGTAGGITANGLQYNAVTLIYGQDPPPPPPDYKDRK